MTREIVETEKRDEDELGQLLKRLEQDSESKTEFDDTGTEAEKIIRYGFEEILDEGGVFYGQLEVEIYDEKFQARGNEALVNDYFAENCVQELDLE